MTDILRLYQSGMSVRRVAKSLGIGDKAVRRRYVDVKGKDLPMSRWKRKHVEAEHGIKVEIVR